MPEKSHYIKEVRLEAIFEANHLGQNDPIEAADAAEAKAALRVGINKEAAFFDKVSQYFPWLIKTMTPSTRQENHDGVDWWLIFNTNDRFPLLNRKIIPAQVKSSPEEVESFKNSRGYLVYFKKKIVVIDFNLRIPRDKFKRVFMLEVSRIDNILKAEQKLQT